MKIQPVEQTTDRNLIGLREGAIRVNRSYSKLREAALRGEFPIVRFSPAGKIYIKPTDLDLWVDVHTIRPLNVGGLL